LALESINTLHWRHQSGHTSNRRHGHIIGLLRELLSNGQTLPECPVSTADGVKAIYVAWLAPGPKLPRIDKFKFFSYESKHPPNPP
jgi:hypothetical protein